MLAQGGVTSLDSSVHNGHAALVPPHSLDTFRRATRAKFILHLFVSAKNNYLTMGSPERPSNDSNNNLNGALNVPSTILGVVIPVCAVLTLVLIFLVWFKSDCLNPARTTGDNDDGQPPPELPKYSGPPGREQDQAPPPYEAPRSHSGPATEPWINDRSADDDCEGATSQQHGDFRPPNTSSPLRSSETTCVNSKASSIRDTPAA